MTPEAATFMPFVPRTKLRPPRLSQDLLRRPRLLEKLQRPQTLSLVIAPAGYGKTTLVSTWLAQSGVPYAWLSLEREDDTLPGFLAGFAAALRRLVPALDGELEKLLQTPSGEPNGEQVQQQILQQILPILLNALDGLEERFVVVLDDYHHVHDATIHQLICRLLEHPPRALQLVLTGALRSTAATAPALSGQRDGNPGTRAWLYRTGGASVPGAVRGRADRGTGGGRPREEIRRVGSPAAPGGHADLAATGCCCARKGAADL